MNCMDVPSSTSEETTTIVLDIQATVLVLSPAVFSKGINGVGDVQLIDVRTAEEVAEASHCRSHEF